jgi:hypothetical protein
VSQPAVLWLKLVPRGNVKQMLKRKKRVRVRVGVRYLPTGGRAIVRSMRVTLIER